MPQAPRGNASVRESNTHGPSELPEVWAVPWPQQRCCRIGVSHCPGLRQAQLSSSLAEGVQCQQWGQE